MALSPMVATYDKTPATPLPERSSLVGWFLNMVYALLNNPVGLIELISGRFYNLLAEMT